MCIDDLLRPIDFLHDTVEGARVHTLRLCDVVADPSLAAHFAQCEGPGQRAITRRFALTSIAQPIGFPGTRTVAPAITISILSAGPVKTPVRSTASGRASTPSSSLCPMTACIMLAKNLSRQKQSQVVEHSGDA